MRLSPARARRGLIEFTTLFCTASALLAFAPSAEAGQSIHRGTASHNLGGVPQPLRLASRRELKAERSFVTSAKALHRCLKSHPSSCGDSRSGLQRAGRHLQKAQHHLNHVALAKAGAARVASAARPPVLTASGQQLTWTRTARSGAYVGERTVPGQAPQAEVINGTSLTPPQVPGTTVSYRVRAAVSGAAWSNEVTISYPAATQATETVAQLAAPTLTVSGQTLDWTAVAGVSTYVLVTKAPGEADQYSVVGGTSITPAAVAGKTVHYSIRTAVEGSPWALEVAITYPAAVASTAPPSEAPVVETPHLETGLNSGTNMTLDVEGASFLGAKVVRVEFPIWATAEQIEPAIAGYAAKGIRVAPLAGFPGSIPTPAQSANLAGWVKAYGPGGSFWAGRSDAQLAIRTIEFGNETSYGYQYGDGAGDASFTLRAETYAVRFKEAAEAISATGIHVGLLAQAEDWTGDWLNAVYTAVPNFTQYVAGWVAHPYGSEWRNKLQSVISETAAHGAPSTIPIDITEWGVTTDNGRCLTENYGLNKCMTYAEAASTLHNTFQEMRAMLGSRFGLFLLYQVRDQQVTGTATEPEAYFGALQHELQPKGAYTTAVQELLASA